MVAGSLMDASMILVFLGQIERERVDNKNERVGYERWNKRIRELHGGQYTTFLCVSGNDYEG